MISATAWVPKGFASEFPEQYELDDEEMERINKMAKLQIDDAKADLEMTNESEEIPNLSKLGIKDDIELDDDLKEYDLENYDEEENEGEYVSIFPGIKEASYHQKDGDEDNAFITLPTEQDLLEEKEELQIYPTDNLILTTKTEDDLSYLEVYVYDDGYNNNKLPTDMEEDEDVVRESSLYTHHDFMLPAFPLCVEWINYKVGNPEPSASIGNFAAIGTFEPQIEIWNLDYVEKSYPDAILGEVPDASSIKISKKKKKKNAKRKNDEYHIDSVLTLSHNRIHRNVLASGSADETVKLWDLNSCKCVKSFNKLHGDKVSSIKWHEKEASILLSGSYDGYVALSDVRISEESQMSKKKQISKSYGDIEVVNWGRDTFFYAGTEKGVVFAFDGRMDDKPIWQLQAHDSPITSIDINKYIDGFMVTSGMTDKSIKLWNISDLNKPSMMLSRDLDVGNVFSVNFAPDKEIAGFITCGGSKSSLKIWDTFTNKTVKSSFGKQIKEISVKDYENIKNDNIIGISSDTEDEDEDEDGEERGWESMDDEE